MGFDRGVADGTFMLCIALMFAVESATVAVPDEVQGPIRVVLSDGACRVRDDQGTVSTFWFRKELPATATPEQIKNGLTYREIASTTLIGVVKFERPWLDFRKQEIAAGVYTLRIATQPPSADHEGTAPTTDFCLLVPAAKDAKPDTMSMKALVELSGESTGGTHPGVVLLFPNHKPDPAPKLAAKGKNVRVLNIKCPVKVGDASATMGLGVAVSGNYLE